MLLLDNSAWTRTVSPNLPMERRKEIARWFAENELGTTLPFLLEAGYSARSADDHREILARLALLPRVAVSPAIEARALRAQAELAERGHHRISPVDVILAACAHESGAGVLHYDSDYDLLLEHTSLAFHSEWLAPRGSID